MEVYMCVCLFRTENALASIRNLCLGSGNSGSKHRLSKLFKIRLFNASNSNQKTVSRLFQTSRGNQKTVSLQLY